MTSKRTILKTRTAIFLLLCFVLSTVAIIILVAVSDQIKNVQGSFLRVFPPQAIEEEVSFNVGHNAYYIAGTTQTDIYLGNYLYPMHLLKINNELTDTSHILLDIPEIWQEDFRAIKVSLDSPFFNVWDGSIPRILHGKVFDWCTERFPFDAEYFQDFLPISKSLYVIRSLHGKTGINMLGVISMDSPHYRFNTGILKKQIDGVFCTEGVMCYNQDRNRVYYVYRYRNEIIEIDSNLSVTNTGRTLDTISVAKIKIDTINNSGSTTFSAPPIHVNKRAATNGSAIFVNSALLARNEPMGAHKKSEVVDVYDLRDMSYQFSFYIHKYSGREGISDFAIRGGRLIVLFQSEIQVYQLNPKYFTTLLI